MLYGTGLLFCFAGKTARFQRRMWHDYLGYSKVATFKRRQHMNITIVAKSNYGTQAYYPVCDNARLFASIAGTTTLTPRTLRIIKLLGINIIITQQEVSYEF